MVKLYKHQKEIIEKNPDKWLLAWGTGVGKSLTALKLSEEVMTLIVCPKSLKEQWRETIKDFGFKSSAYTVVSKEEFKKLDINKSYFDCIIIDEAHFFAGHKSQMHKSMLNFLKKVQPRFVYLLTATPYLSTVHNIRALANLLGKDWSWHKFDQKFFDKIRMGTRWIPKQKTVVDGKPIEDVVSDMVNMLGSAVKMEDCVDVPEQTFKTEYFDLTSEQKKAIENLDESIHIVRWTKTHQICGGTLKSDGYEDDQVFKNEKSVRLLELLNEHQKAVVVCRYNNEIDYLASLVKDRDVFKIRGDVKDRHSVVQAANESKKAVVFIQAQTSEGYELPTFGTMIFYSYDFSLKNYIQVMGRILRMNHLHPCLYISLVIKGTIDEDVYRIIKRKENFDLAIYNK